MAERSVKVRLWASVDEYVRAMDKAKASTKALEKESGANFVKVGNMMTDVGKKATMGVTLPLVGVGAAAVKLGNDFNSTFSQMVGLAGVPAGEIDDLKESVLDLAGETARAPQELAEALYFAASAGLDSAQAMDAVSIAAQAASAGMGTTQDIVGLAASAIASYGKENITAAEATDILVSTIREGRAEPAELASTLGRVLPIAAQLGVTFDEVGGTVAVLSNVFGDTNRTVTATQGMFVKLLSPTQQGRDALAEMGTSVDELHAAVAQDGLLGALELLKAKGFDTNATALRALFDDIEGFQAASALLATDQETLAATFGATENSMGSLSTATGALDEDAQAMKQAWVDLQIAMIQIGEVLGPIVADLAGAISSLASTFSSLPGPAQKVVVAIAALAAAAGPALMVGGSLLRNYEQISSTWSNMGSKSRAAVGAIGLVSAAFALYQVNASRAAAEQSKFDDALSSTAGMADDAAAETFKNIYVLANAVGDVDKTLADFATNNIEAARRLLETGGAAEAGAEAEDKLREAVEKADAARKQETKTNESYGDSVDDVTDSTDEATASTGKHTQSQEDLDKWVAEVNRSVERQVGKLDDKAAADERAKEASDRHREAMEAFFNEIQNNLSTMFDYEGAVIDMQNASEDLAIKTWELEAAYAAGEITTGEYERGLRDLRSQEIDNAKQALETASAYAESQGAIAGTTEFAELQREELIRLADEFPGLRDEIQQFIDILNRIPATKSVAISVTGGGSISVGGGGGNVGGPGRSGTRATGGPTSAGGSYEVLEGGKSELLHEGGRTYLMAANDGYVTPLSGVSGGNTSSTLSPSFDVRVFVGDQEIKDTVRVEIANHDRQLVGAIRQGRRA